MITDGYWRGRAAASMATALVEAGNHDRAEVIAEGIANDDVRAETLAHIAASRGDLAGAESLAGSITAPLRRVQVLTGLGTAARGTAAGDHLLGVAATIAGRIPDAADRACALTAVAGAGHPATAAARSAATQVVEPLHRSLALAQIAAVLAGNGEHEAAREVVTAVEAAAHDVDDPGARAGALLELVPVAVVLGDLDHAAALAATSTEVSRRISQTAAAQADGALTNAFAAVGDLDRADAIAQASTDERWQSSTRAKVLRHMAARGELDRAEAIPSAAFGAVGRYAAVLT